MADLIGQKLGQYEITALLGEGGMATVYRARQKSMGRDVAIKVVESKLARNPEFVKRFEREARVIASLSHAHILKVFESGRQGDLLFLVMELLTGGSLADRIRRERLTIGQAERMLEQLASALDYAHQKGIVHRDLKPQNVLLDEAGNALLTDFGIAKLLDETTSLTQSGTSMGTPSYMSPEQWQGAPLDGRSDVYALGVMVFEMLSGRLPFQGETPFSMMNMHVYQPPPSIREFRPDLPPSIDKVLGKALAKNRDHRFQTAGEMATAFKIALGGVTPPGVELPADALRSTPPAVQAADLTAPQPAVVTPVPIKHPQGSRPSLLVVAAIGLVALIGIGALSLALSGQNGAPSATATIATPLVAMLPTVSETPPPPTKASTATATFNARGAAKATNDAELTLTAGVNAGWASKF